MRVRGLVGGGVRPDVMDGGDEGVGVQEGGEGGFVVVSGCGGISRYTEGGGQGLGKRTNRRRHL